MVRDWRIAERLFIWDIGDGCLEIIIYVDKVKFLMRIAPIPLISEKVWELVKDIDIKYGKGTLNTMDSNCKWKKKSIFFEIPYWSTLYIRHKHEWCTLKRMYAKALLVHCPTFPVKQRMVLTLVMK